MASSLARNSDSVRARVHALSAGLNCTSGPAKEARSFAGPKLPLASRLAGNLKPTESSRVLSLWAPLSHHIQFGRPIKASLWLTRAPGAPELKAGPALLDRRRANGGMSSSSNDRCTNSPAINFQSLCISAQSVELHVWRAIKFKSGAQS